MIFRKGQSVIEILVGIALGAIFILGAATIIAPSFQTNQQVTVIQAKTELATELSDNLKGWAGGNWDILLSLATGSAHTYYLVTTVSPFVATSGTETVGIASSSFWRDFYLSDVYRDSNGNVTTTVSGNSYDPSTKQVTVVVSTTTFNFYLTRNVNNIFNQTSWAGGTGGSGAVTLVSSTYASATGTAVIGDSLQLSSTSAASGGLSTWTIASHTLPSAVYVLSGAAYNSYLYAAGGIDGSGNPTSTIFQSTINANGSLSTFAKASHTLPTALSDLSVIANSSTFYVVGGYNSAGTSTVSQATINASGSLGAFAKASHTLPAVLADAGVAAYNSHLYTAGGFIPAATANVYQATINANGSLGTFATASHSLPSALSNLSAVAYNGYFYTTGGLDASSNPTSTVFQAVINADGSLGTFAKASHTLPHVLGFTSAIASNGYLYTVGGTVDAANTVTTTVFQAVINADGSLGTFATASHSLPSALGAGSAAAYNGYLYSMGGYTSAPTSSVFQSSIGSGGGGYNATGTLDSVTFDTGVASGTQLNSVIWQGVLPTGTHVGFQFAVANATNTTWTFKGPSGGSSDYFGYNNVTPGIPNSLLATAGGYTLFNGYRYFRYRITLFADASSTYTPTVNQVVVNWSP